MIDKNTIEHTNFLLQALEEAKKFQGFCAPNPCVGALAVQHGKIIAKAAHQKSGGDHAEAALLKKLPKNLTDVTLYVTLEPCNHWGKTPPCVDAIIAYGVKTVVYAYRDPNKHIPENCSEQILKKHGIHVIYSPVEDIASFYAPYTYWVHHKLPWITAKWAQSFDGKVALKHQQVLISNKEAQIFTHQQRLKADLILTSSATIRIDNPLLNARLNNEEIPKHIGILDSQLSLTGGEQLFAKAQKVHIFHDSDYKPSWTKPNVVFHSVTSGLNLKEIASLIARLGYHEVWLEAGPKLMANFHQEKLIRTTHIILAPKIIGDAGLNAFQFNYNYFNYPYDLQIKQLGDNILTTFTWDDLCLQE